MGNVIAGILMGAAGMFLGLMVYGTTVATTTDPYHYHTPPPAYVTYRGKSFADPNDAAAWRACCDETRLDRFVRARASRSLTYARASLDAHKSRARTTARPSAFRSSSAWSSAEPRSSTRATTTERRARSGTT